MEERFLYEIRPVRPIIINGRRTRRACSLNLTKDEVKEYLASANVYRRFGGTDVVKVTGANLDQLHVSKEVARGIINPDAGNDNPENTTPDNNQEVITGDTNDDKVDKIEKAVTPDNSDAENAEDADETPNVEETTEDVIGSEYDTEEPEDSDTEETEAESSEDDQTAVEKIDTVEDDNGSIADDAGNESTEETEEEKAEPVKASNIQERAKVIRPNYQQYNGNRKKKKNHK